MDYEVEIYLLSSKFIADYPIAQYPELMYKQGRPYSCLLIDTHMDYYICVPFRSAIQHRNAYMFRGTQRSVRTHSGLDYSKVVLIRNSEYIDSATKAIVDQDEYTDTITHLPQIVSEVTDYVDKYIAHVTGSAVLHPREFSRRYQFSTLPYFHDIMGIEATDSNA